MNIIYQPTHSMSASLTILMAQINPTVGAIEANTKKIIDIITSYQHTHDVILFSELTLTGYPPEDLLLRPELFNQVELALQTIMSYTSNTHVIIGHPSIKNGICYNTASVIHEHRIATQYHKQDLPNYGVFDEKRYFTPGPARACTFTINDVRMGVCICEDIWHKGPVEQLIEAKAHIVLCLNASPFDVTKQPMREAIIKNYAQQGLYMVYVNQIGGQDDLIFDGQSFACDKTGRIIARAPAFKEHLETLHYPPLSHTTEPTPSLSTDALIYEALCCGLKDYVHKNGFKGVLLGLSGGIDSALTLAIAVDALGKEHVHAILMPSRYTASISHEDALSQLNILHVTHDTISIEPTFNTLLHSLEPAFHGETTHGLTEENLQARIRGILLMALSNKTGQLVLTTSNKSEVAVGYSTLYGDMCGGFSVLKDVLKTMVYRLARYRNTIQPVIPMRVIERPPSAELAHNQTDQDSLPDYPVLDAIITHYMEDKLSASEIIAHGFDSEIVHHVIKLITRNEYKRKQSAPGVKISTCAFGREWRYPLTCVFESN